MSMDPVADMLTMIRNANARFHEKADIPASKIKEQICRVLKEEGYISSYKKIDDYKQGILRIYLKYSAGNERCITRISRVSRPGLRVYRNYTDLPRVYRGLGIAIISTSKGVITDREARKKHLGGEVVCTVW